MRVEEQVHTSVYSCVAHAISMVSVSVSVDDYSIGC